MTNNIINPATALIIGSLVVLSSQALAFSPDNQEMTNTGVLDNFELLIAQSMSVKCEEEVEPEEQADLASSIALAQSLTEEALGVAQASSLPSGGKSAIANALAGAQSLLNEASALAQSTPFTKRDAAAIAKYMAAAESLINTVNLGYHQLFKDDPLFEAGKSIAEAQSATGEAKILAQSVARCS